MARCAGVAPPQTLSFIPTGPAGVRETLERMARIVKDHRLHPLIRQLAVEVRQAAKVPSRDYLGELKALHRFVGDWITYVRDIRDVETLQYPTHVLRNRAGDCDDQAMLLASLLESIGHPTRFVAMGFSQAPHPRLLEWHHAPLYSHVLAESLIGNRWVPAETTIERPVGWSPPGQTSRMIKNV